MIVINQPGPSRYALSDSEMSDECTENDNDKCCVCKKHSPPALHDELYTKITLFCCKQNAICRGTNFLCPCCHQEE